MEIILNFLWNILSFSSNIIIALIFIFLIVMLIKNKFLFSIAFRNVFRNLRRSTITITAIAIGAIAIIIFGGFIEDSFYGLRESTIHSQIGHIQMYKKGYKENGTIEPLKYKMYDFIELKKLIMNDTLLKDKIDAIMPELEISGLISTGDSSTSFMARGVDPDSDLVLSSFERIKTGRKLNKNDRAKIVLGHKLAKTIDAKLGDPVMLLVQTPSVGLNVLDVEVKGLSESFSTDYDKIFLKMPITDVWDLLGVEYIDKYIILLHKTEDLKSVLDRLKKITQENNFEVEFNTWEDLAMYYKGVVSLYSGIFNFVKWIICLIIIVFITNTLFMAVMERVNEIGTLRTIGTSKKIIIQNFIIESLIMGIIGGIAGILVAFALSKIINIFGIPMPPAPGSSSSYTAKIRIDKEAVGFILFSLKLSIITALFASLLPSKKAINMNIVDSLRHY